MGDGAAALIDGATAPATTVEQMLALRTNFVKVFIILYLPYVIDILSVIQLTIP